MKLLMDTCACLLFAENSPRLSAETYGLIQADETEVFVSAITTAELACLLERGRLKLSESWKIWFRRQLEMNGWRCRNLSLEILEEAYSRPSPLHRDPADRAIIATARLEGMTVVTTDRLILDYPHVPAIS